MVGVVGVVSGGWLVVGGAWWVVRGGWCVVGVGCCVGAGWWVVWWWCFVVVLVGGGGSFNQAFLSVSSSISVVFIQYFRAHTQTQKLSPFWLKLVESRKHAC